MIQLGPMPQIQLPIFPEGVCPITSELAFKKDSGPVLYFNGSMPVFVHEDTDNSNSGGSRTSATNAG